MEPTSPQRSPTTNPGVRFENTVWSEILAAGRPDGLGSAEALEKLCAAYWYPIYAYLRRRGLPRHEAKDLTQGFFHYLLRKNVLQAATPARGRFRSFLLGTLKNFLSNEAGREQALKRGGGAELISLDEAAAEGRYLREPRDEQSPEKLFDRRWALTVLEEAGRRLEQEFVREGSEREFAELKGFLNHDQGVPYRELAARLGKSEVALRSTVSRLRRGFRDTLRGVIRETVSDTAQIEEELKHLREALRDR